MSEDKWCPENDGAYRMEMAAKYKHVEAQKTRLELAASDMLEALQDITEVTRSGHHSISGDWFVSRKLMSKARAVIAKATNQ